MEVRKKKNRSLHSNLVRVLAQILQETQRTCPLYDQTLCPTCKGGGHASILLSFLYKFAILATQKAMAQCPPLNTPQSVKLRRVR